MKKPTAKQVLTKIKEYFFVTLAGVINAVSLAIFINPAKLVAGGISGLSSSLSYIFVRLIPNVPFETMVSILYFGLNVPLLILSLIFLRGDFTYKTIWATLVSTVLLRVIPTELQFDDHSKMTAILIGGVLIGLSMYIAAINNGSNAGTEIIARLVAKFKPEIDMSKILMLSNLAITGAGSVILMTLQNEKIWVVIYSLMYVMMGSKILGMLMRGLDHPQKFLIITSNPDELSQAITDTFKRGFSSMDIINRNIDGKERKIISVIVQYRQAAKLKQIIKKYDPAAFTIVKDVYDVFSRPLFNRNYK